MSQPIRLFLHDLGVFREVREREDGAWECFVPIEVDDGYKIADILSQLVSQGVDESTIEFRRREDHAWGWGFGEDDSAPTVTEIGGWRAVDEDEQKAIEQRTDVR